MQREPVAKREDIREQQPDAKNAEVADYFRDMFAQFEVRGGTPSLRFFD